MSKPADADNTDFIRRLYIKLHNRVKNRDATAEEGSGFAHVKSVGQLDGPAPMTTDALGKTSWSADDRSLRSLAKVLISTQTLRASHVAFGEPPKPHGIADCQIFYLVPDGDNFANGFVSRHNRINRYLPFIIAHGQIRAT